MPDPLHITSCLLPDWGRASGFSREFGDQMVVVFGPNETGKSSIASALAALLAGPGTGSVLHRLGEPTASLRGQLEATIGPAKLAIKVHSKVPNHNQDKKVTESTMEADLDGTPLNRADLRDHLGGIEFGSFYDYYWIDAERIHVTEQDKDDDHLSRRSIFGDRDPVKIANKLDGKGENLIGKTSRKEGSANHLAKDLPDLEAQIRNARSSGAGWHTAEVRKSGAEEASTQAKGDLEECRDRIDVIELARSAVDAYREFREATDELERCSTPTDDQRRLADQQQEIQQLLKSLVDSQVDVRKAEDTLRDTRKELGDWEDLEEVVDVTDDLLRTVQQAETNVGIRRTDLETAVAERDLLESNRPNILTSSSGRKPATATVATVGLVLLAVVLAATGQGLPAAAVGMVTAATLWRRSSNRATGDGSNPVVEAEKNLVKTESRLRSTIQARDDLLTGAGIPEPLIPSGNDDLSPRVERLLDVKKARDALSNLEASVVTSAAALQEEVPLQTVDAMSAQKLLDDAVAAVAAHEEAGDLVSSTSKALQKLLGGSSMAAEALLEVNDEPDLEHILEAERKTETELETALGLAKDSEEEARRNLAGAEIAADLESPLLQRGALLSEIRHLTMTGLANRLAARLLRDAMTTYLDDNGPRLLESASRVGSRIGDGWSTIRIDPHSEDNGLIVESTAGTHPVSRLSTGGRSLVNLALRLSSLTVQSAQLPVRLPVIMDDPFSHLDHGRRRAAFEVLRDFSDHHQVIYFTCHREHADMAEGMGVRRIDL